MTYQHLIIFLNYFRNLQFSCPVHAKGESSSSSEEDLKNLATVFETKLNSTIITDFITLTEKTKKQCPDIEQKLDVS